MYQRSTKSSLRCYTAGQTSGSGSGGEDGVDRLSALPDELLHQIMSSLKAWEVVRTCVLSRRWSYLWASAPCVDLRVRYFHGDSASRLGSYMILRTASSSPVMCRRLQSSDRDEHFDNDDANTWIRTAIKRNCRVIYLTGHRGDLGLLDHTSFVSHHLKILKFSYVVLDDGILRQLSSRCTSLEELDLKDCLVTGHEIVSDSLKTLMMVKCKIKVQFSITAPNLVLLCLIRPYIRVPSFNNLSSLVTGTIILDDSFLSDDFEHLSDEDDIDETTDDDDDNDKRKYYKIERGFDHGLGYKDDYDYGSDIDSDDSTCEYGEVAQDSDDEKHGYNGNSHNSSKDGKYCGYGENQDCNGSKILGGHNALQGLSNATNLELLTDAGEVVLSRELKRCPTFSNLKILSLGEWCMAADFDALVLFLQHSPNIERLFLELKLKCIGKRYQIEGRIICCKHLRMVKIKCSKDDVRVHMLAHLFRTNGVPLERIYVRRTGSSYLRGKRLMRALNRQEHEFWANF